ncbi:GntR family transcriptional regulator [Candidimonas nitroreducens]|uniref:GntR family transcriptional regulator n=1 Tax=Candidimonas nitroreducens TaxID=683354 RepID=A0A225MCW6_9BURK|nr:GntR family transcriptional regulator [Candidimonas nitroreducens]OWT59134.1 GntR family transcriptional regulator [Candidimonas nitroreducens]
MNESSGLALLDMEGAVEARLFSGRQLLTLTLSEQIAAQIGDRIIAGAIEDGTPLPEQELAERYQVSRGPIREALRILEREGLVELHPRRGATVTSLNSTELAEIYEIRASLLSMVARKNVASHSAEYLNLLERTIEQLEHMLGDTLEDATRYAETVFRASLNSAMLTQSKRLANIVTSLSLQTLRYSKLGLRSQERRKRSFLLWKQGYEAAKTGDADLAEKLSQLRMKEAWQAMVSALDDSGKS